MAEFETNSIAPVDAGQIRPHYVALYRGGRLPVDRLMTHRLKLDEINEGFDRLHAGIGVRQIVVFD